MAGEVKHTPEQTVTLTRAELDAVLSAAYPMGVDSTLVQQAGIEDGNKIECMKAVLKLALEYLRGQNPDLSSGGTRNSKLRVRIIEAIAKAEGQS